ncbi:MAG: NlpC/P60 family protein [Pseudomonadota bacterium]
MWSDPWVGLPFEKLGRGPHAYDCLGLYLALVRERLGRELPDPRLTIMDAVRDRRVGALRAEFVRVKEAREGDALLFFFGRTAFHVGYALGARDMLHVGEGMDGSAIERWASPLWREKLEGIYRVR